MSDSADTRCLEAYELIRQLKLVYTAFQAETDDNNLDAADLLLEASKDHFAVFERHLENRNTA